MALGHGGKPVFAHGEPVELSVYAEGAEDDHGNEIESWAAPVTVKGCGFDPGTTDEVYSPGRDAVITTPKLYMPAGAPLPGARDRIAVRGRIYEVSGDAAEWRNPYSGSRFGAVVNLERVSG